MVFGGPTHALFRGYGARLSGDELAASLGDVLLALGRVDRLPSRVFVTSEVERVDEPGLRFDPITLLSRPARIDRRAPPSGSLRMHASILPHK